MTIHLGKLFGIHIERAMGSDNNWYLAAVIWVPRDFTGRYLRHFYPSIRWF